MNNNNIRVGLMGFGRIGRNLFRLASQNSNVEIAAISDLGNPEILHYLLQRDSIHGSFDDNVELDGSALVLEDGRRSEMLKAVAPTDVSWDDYDVDIVVDATGKYTSKAEMEGHLSSGAPRVLLTTLPDDPIDRVVITGVNNGSIIAADQLVSAGSSTTHAVALVLRAIGAKHEIDHAMMTSVHAYTSDQPLQDTVGKDFRRSRSAAENIIPNETPTPRWIESIMPQYKDRIDGISLNVPVADGSYVDLTIQMSQSGITVEEINQSVSEFASKMPHVLSVTDDPIVSSDIIGDTHSTIFDLQATMVTGKRLAKVISWYDNGWGHAARVLDTIKAYAALEGQGDVS